MQIQLNRYFVRNFHLEQISNPIENDNNIFNYEFITSFYSIRENDFFVEFNIEIKKVLEFSCSFTYVFIFSTTEKIDEKFIKSHFPIINAPAIAFPYIRSFLSNFTLNAGYLPTILPSINFLKIEPSQRKVFYDGVLIKSQELIN